jgi:hypothetical protein
MRRGSADDIAGTTPERYRGITAALATRHHKAPLIAPPLRPLGLDVVVVDVDTDRFGTFTGEIERPDSPLAVVEAKARAAIDTSRRAVGVASEGTFTPHPDAPWLSVDTELVALVDNEHDIVVVGRSVNLIAATTTLARTDAAIADFCRQVGFPSQALVVRTGVGTGHVVTKGITDHRILHRAVREARSLAGRPEVRLEADLRAHLCPTRRPGIIAAAYDLACRLRRVCARCSSPGVGLLTTSPGRPCGMCGTPTPLARSEIHGCVACSWTSRVMIAGAADPAACLHCNP